MIGIRFWILIFCCSNVMLACNPYNEIDCIPQDENCKYLYLDGTNQTLIDNSLRCFKLDSAAKPNDSLIRIWSLELNFPDTPFEYRVRLFELGMVPANHSANYYTLSWGLENDSLLRVKYVTKDKLLPKSGWESLEKKLVNSEIQNLYLLPDSTSTLDDMSSFSMLIMQHLNGKNIFTLDFTGKNDFTKNLRERKFVNFIRLIEKEFSVSMTIHSYSGHDQLGPKSTTTQ